MNTNNVIKELLANNKDTLRYLHICYGLNFEKPFTAIKLDIPFTLNQVEKLTGCREGFIFIKEEKSIFNNKQYMRMAVKKGSFVTIEIEKPWNLNSDVSRPDTFYLKSDFEKCRKNKDDYNKMESAYFIAQDKQYLQDVKKFAADKMERFRDVSFTEMTWRYSGGSTLHSKIDGACVTQNGVKFKLLCFGHNRTDIVNGYDFIDKSGYIVNDKRESLIRRSKALKEEKARKACESKAFQNEIDIVTACRENATLFLKRAFAATTTNFERFNGWGGLIHKHNNIIYDCNNFIERINTGDFKTIDGITGKYSAIIESYNEFEKLCKGGEN